MSEITTICPLCGTPNQGGKFCVICGTKLEEPVAAPAEEPVAAPVAEPVAEPAPAPVVEAPVVTAPVMLDPEEVDNYVEEIAPQKEKKAKKPVVGIVITLIIAILLAGFAGLVVYDDITLRNVLADTQAQADELALANQQLGQENFDLQKDLQAAEKQVEELGTQAEEAGKYQDIFEHIVEKNAEGVAADPYFVSDNLLVMKKGETKELTIYADWDKDASASLTCSSKAASIKFADETWDGLTTTLEVTASEEGVCLATFTNSADEGTFQVLIIVTE